MKKIFHRKKNSAPSSPEQTPARSQRPENGNADPSFRTSRYESTAPADLPQTGHFPLKGNNSSVSFQGRPSETFSRGQGTTPVESSPRPSNSSPYYGSLPVPRVTSASNGNGTAGRPPTDGSADYGGVGSYQQRQNAPPNDPPIQDFSNLNLHTSQDRDDQDDFPLRQHHGSHPHAQNERETGHSSGGYERRPFGGQSSPGVRMVGKKQPTQSEGYTSRQTKNSMGREQDRYGYGDQNYGHPAVQTSNYPAATGAEDEGTMRRTASIPRKDVPRVLQNPGAAGQSTASSTNPIDRSRYPAKTSSASRYQYDDDHRLLSKEASTSYSNAHAGSQRSTRDVVRPSAQEVMDRAGGNTYDTEIAEKVAPAVVHETVHQNIHHVRNEVITREIHEHEVHHRILPVIDVEVLPPRHFLPVEGGGLVEISGKEVPGRGNNWVIAETASKIPSDQAAPKGSRSFSARQFFGSEGDAMKYTTAEGHPGTEQTWVHPPELETGGRSTGQTWPMEFGSESVGKAGREHKSSKSPKSKWTRKSMEAQPSNMQQPRAGTYT